MLVKYTSQRCYQLISLIGNKSLNGFYSYENVFFDAKSEFENGLALITKDEKYGYINEKGEIVVPCIYDSVDEFGGGLNKVVRNGKTGYINENGVEVVPCIYDYIYGFSLDGIAKVEKDGKYGFCFDDSIEIVAVNCKNIEVLDLPFDEKTEGIIKFEKKGKCSLLDKDGKVLFERDCDELKIKNGKLIAITY